MAAVIVGSRRQAWRFSQTMSMVWAPAENRLALAAVPVTTDDVEAGLSQQDYRARLTSRVV